MVDDVAWQNVAPGMVEQAMVRGDVQVGSGFPTQLQIYNRPGAKTEDIAVCKYADHGVDLYGNAVPASAKFISENLQAISAVLRAINRALKETIADSAAAVKYVMRRNPLLNQAGELEKRKLVMEFMDAANTRSDGLGSISKIRRDNQVNDINLAFGLNRKPSPDLIFNSSFLPRAAERRYR